jgi:hypothetical protein
VAVITGLLVFERDRRRFGQNPDALYALPPPPHSRAALSSRCFFHHWGARAPSSFRTPWHCCYSFAAAMRLVFRMIGAGWHHSGGMGLRDTLDGVISFDSPAGCIAETMPPELNGLD